MNTFGVYVGRFNPIHRGHGVVIQKMLETCGLKQSLLVIGSANASFSLRHFYSYCERRGIILSLFPELRVVGLPDFPDDDGAWLTALDDLIRLAGADPREVTYFGGCEEDVRFFLEDGRHCVIVSRFGDDLVGLSATRVRDALIHKRDAELYELLIPGSLPQIKTLFTKKWEEFKKI